MRVGGSHGSAGLHGFAGNRPEGGSQQSRCEADSNSTLACTARCGGALLPSCPSPLAHGATQAAHQVVTGDFLQHRGSGAGPGLGTGMRRAERGAPCFEPARSDAACNACRCGMRGAWLPAVLHSQRAWIMPSAVAATAEASLFRLACAISFSCRGDRAGTCGWARGDEQRSRSGRAKPRATGIVRRSMPGRCAGGARAGRGKCLALSDPPLHP